SGFGLVIGSQDHVGPAQWLRLPEAPGIALIGWGYGGEGSESAVVELLRGGRLHWRRFRRQVQLSNRDLLLLHSASAGDEVRELDPFGERYAVTGDGIPVRLEPGAYAIESAEVGGDLDRDPIGCVVCRWIPLGETG